MQISQLLDSIGQHPGGRLGAALGVFISVFLTVWALLDSLSIEGSVHVFSYLTLSSLLVASIVYSALEVRVRKLAELAKPSPLPKVRRTLEIAIAALEKPEKGVVHAAIERYENRIRALQAKLVPMDLGKPIFVEEGVFEIGAYGYAPDEAPPHEVHVNSFLIDRTPVINQEFGAFLVSDGGAEWGPDEHYSLYGVPYFLCEFIDRRFPPEKWNHPVVWVSWHSAVAFCNWRSNKDNKDPVYDRVDACTVKVDFSKNGWRLPTEAEWEVAARVTYGRGRGPLDIIKDLDPTVANFDKMWGDTTPVGLFESDPLKICDLLGNVKEWCHDWYQECAYSSEVRKNPIGPEAGVERVFRGGSWMDSASGLRLTRRGKLLPQNTNPDFGFRCVRRA